MAHPLDDSFMATNQQLIEKMKRVSGIELDGSAFRRLKLKFVGKKAKLPLLICLREGFRTSTAKVPSLYQFTPAFKQLLEVHDAL